VTATAGRVTLTFSAAGAGRDVAAEAHAVLRPVSGDGLHERARVEVGVDVDDHQASAPSTSSRRDTSAIVGRIRVIANSWFSASLLAQHSRTITTR